MADARFDPGTLESLVRYSGPLLLRFVDGFDDDTRVTQAAGLPNHLSWTLGHVSLTMHRCADLVSGFNQPQQLPTSDWIHGDGTAGDPSRYDTESVCIGSTPKASASGYPRLRRAIEIFEAAIDRLATEAGGATNEMLVREVKWGSGPLLVGSLVHRVALHNGTHAGQLTDLRRALGMARVIG